MPKISRYKQGLCSICKRQTFVRYLVNNRKIISVCKDCMSSISLTVDQLLTYFGDDLEANAS